jgi:DME family drug/metabolite transporter
MELRTHAPSRLVPAPATRGLLQVALGGVLWGTGGLVVPLIRRQTAMPVPAISAYRTLVGAAVLLATVVAHRQWRGMIATVRRHPRAVVAAGVGTAAYQVLYFASVVNVGVSVATVISLGLAPVILTVSGSLITRSRPSVHHVQVVALAVTGLVLIQSGGAGLTWVP